MKVEDVEALANRLIATHLKEDPGWRFAWDNARSRGGSARYSTKRITMSRHLVPMWTEEQVVDTLLHEIGHALAGYKAAHGPEWQAAVRSIGGVPRRTHDNETVEWRWVGTCGCVGPGAPKWGRHRLSAKVREWGRCPRCHEVIDWRENVPGVEQVAAERAAPKTGRVPMGEQGALWEDGPR